MNPFLKKFIFTITIASFCLISTPKAQASDPRVTAIATMALYGTVGGALLGTASLAFGAKGRSVAIGASLGLYTGIIFGTYVIVTHKLQRHQIQNPSGHPVPDNYYPNSDGETPYRPGFDGAGSGGGGLYDGTFYRSMSLQQLGVNDSHKRQELDRMLAQRPNPFEIGFELFRYQF